MCFLLKLSDIRETFNSTFLRLVALFITLSVACCCISYMHGDFRVSVLPACAVKQIFLISNFQFVSSVLKKSLLQAKPKLGRCPGVLQVTVLWCPSHTAVNCIKYICIYFCDEKYHVLFSMFSRIHLQK